MKTVYAREQGHEKGIELTIPLIMKSTALLSKTLTYVLYKDIKSQVVALINHEQKSKGVGSLIHQFIRCNSIKRDTV